MILLFMSLLAMSVSSLAYTAKDDPLLWAAALIAWLVVGATIEIKDAINGR